MQQKRVSEHENLELAHSHLLSLYWQYLYKRIIPAGIVTIAHRMPSIKILKLSGFCGLHPVLSDIYLYPFQEIPA